MRGTALCRTRAGWLVALIGLLLLGGCGVKGRTAAMSTDHFPLNTGFMQGRVQVGGETRTVWVFVPRNYQPGNKYPAILFLHGLFEAGNGGSKVLSAGLGPVIAQRPDDWPFITIFPQSTGKWDDETSQQFSIAALDWAQQRWSIDPSRVTLAGLSYGGLGVWQIGARYPDRFAALVPVSGHSAPECVENLVSKPVWAFAYQNDPWVNAGNSEYMFHALESRGGKAYITEFPGNGHDPWKLAVNESRLIDWLLLQRNTSQGTVPFAHSGDRSTIANAN